MKYVFKKKRNILIASAVDAIFGIFFKPKPHFDSHLKPKKILVVRLDHLGDILPATAFPQILKENFPGAEVHFLTNRMGEELLKNNPYVDKVWVGPSWFQRTLTSDTEVNRIHPLVRRLREEAFDLGLAPRGDARENYLLWRAKIRNRVGYGITGGSFFLTHSVPYVFGAHESQHGIDLLKYIGVQNPHSSPKIYWTEAEELECRAALQKKGYIGNGWIGLQVDAGTPTKEWPLENYQLFLEMAAEKVSSEKIVFLGTSARRAHWLDGVIEAKGKKKQWLNLVGKTNLRELFYLLKTLKIYAGLDSGPSHVAASYGIPSLFLYSGTNVFDQWKPLAENAYTLTHPVPCSPCRQTKCPIQGHPCLSQITPAQVMSWVLERSYG